MATLTQQGLLAASGLTSVIEPDPEPEPSLGAIAVQADPPGSPADGDLWVEDDALTGAGASDTIELGSAAPADPADRQLWGDQSGL